MGIESQQVWAADNDHVGFTSFGWLPFIHMSPLGFSRFFQGDGASFHFREPGNRVGCDSLRVVENPILLPSVSFPLRFDQINCRINRYEVTVAASYFPDVRLVGSSTIVKVITILSINGFYFLNRKQCTAAHVPVAAPERCFRILDQPPGEKSPHQCRMNNRPMESRVERRLNEFVEFAELIIVD